MRVKSESSTESGWPVILAAVAMLAFIFGLTPTGNRICAELIQVLDTRGRRAVTLSRSELLLVSDKQTDQINVVATVAPRGYSVLLAENAQAGMQKLLKEAGNIGVIVVDATLEDAPSVVQMAGKVSPAARVVTLSPKHTATDLAGLLLTNLEN